MLNQVFRANNMEDKLVVGRRAIRDGLKDMDRFAGNDAGVVFPEWNSDFSTWSSSSAVR